MSTTDNVVASHPLGTAAPNVAVATVTPSPSGVDAFDEIAVRECEALPANAVVIVADGRTVAPHLPADVWGLQAIAADTAVDGGQLVLFAAVPLTAQPDPRAHDSDVVLRLRAGAAVSADGPVFLEVDVMLAQGGRWATVGTWTGMDANWPHRIAATVTRLMHSDSGPVIDPTTPAEAAGRFGALRDMVSAGRLHEGEKLLCLRPGTGVRYEANVVDGGIQLPDGRWFARPSGALAALGYRHQNGWVYWSRARDGVALSGIRLAPTRRASSRRREREPQLIGMVTDGTLNVGDELRYVQPRKGIVHTAHVLADGQLQLDNGRRYPTPAAAINAACHGALTDGWRTWRRTSDNRTLAELRDEHRNRVTPPTPQQAPEPETPDSSGKELP